MCIFSGFIFFFIGRKINSYFFIGHIRNNFRIANSIFRKCSFRIRWSKCYYSYIGIRNETVIDCIVIFEEISYDIDILRFKHSMLLESKKYFGFLPRETYEYSSVVTEVVDGLLSYDRYGIVCNARIFCTLVTSDIVHGRIRKTYLI